MPDRPMPKTLRPGFDFDEAIWLTELCARAYVISEYEDAEDLRALYNAMYTDEWDFFDYISDYRTDSRMFTIKRRGTNQYALVFRGSVMATKGIEGTNMQANTDDRLIEYRLLPGEKNPPPLDARVHSGWYTIFEALQAEMELFFDVLTDTPITPRTLATLTEVGPAEATSRLESIKSALTINYGMEAATEFADALNEQVQKARDGYINPFQIDTKPLFDKIKKNGTVKPERLELYVTGYSLGAAVASFCAIYLKRYWETRKDFPPAVIKLYTTGGAKIGNKSFATYYNERMKEYAFRIVNLLDPSVNYPEPKYPRDVEFQLSLPNIEYVRQGDQYYARFEGVGELVPLMGMGFQNLALNFGGPFKLTIPVPFPHGIDGYQQMLEEMYQRYRNFWKPVRAITDHITVEQKEEIDALQAQIRQLQGTVEQSQVAAATTAPKRPSSS